MIRLLRLAKGFAKNFFACLFLKGFCEAFFPRLFCGSKKGLMSATVFCGMMQACENRAGIE